MNEINGFILTPEMYHKKEWCKMYYIAIKEYRILQRRIEKAIKYINSTGYGTDFSMSAEEVDKTLEILEGKHNNEQ